MLFPPTFNSEAHRDKVNGCWHLVYDYAVCDLNIDFTSLKHLKNNFRNWRDSVIRKKNLNKTSGIGAVPEAQLDQLGELIDEVLVGTYKPAEQVGLHMAFFKV